MEIVGWFQRTRKKSIHVWASMAAAAAATPLVLITPPTNIDFRCKKFPDMVQKGKEILTNPCSLQEIPMQNSSHGGHFHMATEQHYPEWKIHALTSKTVRSSGLNRNLFLFLLHYFPIWQVLTQRI